MAPLPESNTQRYFLTYQVAGHNHTLTARCDAGFSESAASEEIGAFLEAMESYLYASLFVKFEVAAEGSNVRNPANWTGPAEWGADAGPEQSAPNFWSFVGKDNTGRRFRVELFGRKIAPNTNYRVFAVDDTTIEAALAELETTAPIWLTIAGNGPVLNQYANMSVADHWIEELRH